VKKAAEGKIQKFVTRQSNGILWAWVTLHAVIFIALEGMGLVPGVSHLWDLVTFVVLDEVAQLILVAPAVRELWRRDEIEQEASAIAEKIFPQVESLIYSWNPAKGQVAIPIEDIVPTRRQVSSAQERALDTIVELLESTGDWKNGQVMFHSTEHRIYPSFMPTDDYVSRHAAGDRFVPLRRHRRS